MEVIRNFPDSEIVANLRAGKRMDETIKAIYREHFEPLAWYIVNNSGNRQDAEDIFQEVVVAFIDSVQRDKFRGESTIKTFLFSLNRFTWLNELKRRNRSLAREEKYEHAQDKELPDTSDLIADREGKAAVMKLVEELGDTCKKILVLFYYENRSMKEILDVLHYDSEQVVRNKKYKCLKQLEQMLTSNPAAKKTLLSLLYE